MWYKTTLHICMNSRGRRRTVCLSFSWELINLGQYLLFYMAQDLINKYCLREKKKKNNNRELLTICTFYAFVVVCYRGHGQGHSKQILNPTVVIRSNSTRNGFIVISRRPDDDDDIHKRWMGMGGIAMRVGTECCVGGLSIYSILYGFNVRGRKTNK